MTRAVFFDIGDTLVHRPAIGPGRRLAAALGLPREAGRTITELLFREPFESPAALAARLDARFGPLGDGAARVAEIWRAQEQEPVEVPGATACVAAVATTGAHVGVVSNIWAPYAAGFRRACPAVVSRLASWHLSYELGVAKPAPGLFEAALAAAGVAAERAVMVGDSLDKDVLPAVALGLGAIWIPAGGEEGAAPDAPTLPSGAVRVRDLDEARAVLLAVLGAAVPPRAFLCALPARAIGSA